MSGKAGAYEVLVQYRGPEQAAHESAMALAVASAPSTGDVVSVSAPATYSSPIVVELGLRR